MGNVLMHENELKRDLFKKDKTSLREVVTITNINDLILPRISYKVDGIEYENEVEQELKTKSDLIKFTKNKFKISVNIPNIVNDVDNKWVITYLKDKLRQALEYREKYCIFKNINTEEEHMNIYSSQNAIKEIEGENLFKTIKNSLSDLGDMYCENTAIVMRKTDYIKMICDLSDENNNFYNKQFESILGVKLIFCEFAEKPVIGDFSKLHINYENGILFEKDVNATDNFNKIIVSGNFDIRLLLTSAFRIAEVQSVSRLTKKD